MKMLIFPVILVLVAGAVLADTIVVFEFTIDKADNVEVLDIRLDEGMQSAGEGDYSVLLLGADGEVSSARFQPTFTAWADGEFPFPKDAEIGRMGSVELEKAEFILRLPFSEDALELQVRNKETVIFSQEIDFCNDDGSCDETENYLSCEDCASGSADLFCDGVFDGICDPDCRDQMREYADTDCTCGNGVCDGREDGYYCQADCGKTSNPLQLYLILGVVGVVLLIVLIVIGLVRLKKHQS